MAMLYEWRALTEIASDVPPNTSLTVGSIPATQGQWTTATAGQPVTVEKDYYYHDANNADGSGWYTDSNSTRVKVHVVQTWTPVVDNQNNLIIHMTSVIGPIIRDNKEGTCDDTPGRHISVATLPSNTPDVDITDNQVGTERTIYNSTMNVFYSLLIPPGMQEPSLTVYNENLSSGLIDQFLIGVQFRNTLQPDYRPGAVIDNWVWNSHNRPNGICYVNNGEEFVQMRTIGAPASMGNTPSIYHNDKWYNMNKIGKDADGQ